MNPYKIDGPAVISFSGGRTSGYMLKQIIDAHGGKLPDDVHVVFANTGKERQETLDFVRDCGERWGVPITWVEYAGKTSEPRFKIVDHASASRNGEPFRILVIERSFLPNPVARFCTVELKIRTMHAYLRSIGFEEWTSYVGIRADEPWRVAKLSNQDYGKHETKEAPLVRIGVTKKIVGDFWKAQPFDLGLPNVNGTTPWGNCDLCYLKGLNQKLSMIRQQPSAAIWWIETEREAKRTASGNSAVFRSDQPSYQSMYDMATNHGELFPFDDEALTDCGCTD